MNLADPGSLLKQRCTGILSTRFCGAPHPCKTAKKSARKYGKAGKTPRHLTVAGFLAQFKEEG